jgi:hypothetical protein
MSQPVESFFVCREEEAPVTLQIALIGSDGWVLASDKKARSPLESASSWLTTKISYDTEWACSFWGDEIARAVHDQVIDALQSGELSLKDKIFNAKLRQLSDRVWQSRFASAGEPERAAQAQHGRRGIIFMRKPPHHIVDLSISSQSTLEPSETKTARGDTRSSAVYLLECYYDRNKSQPVSTLKRLAAHTILMSSHINLQNIEGLQIVSCTINGAIVESNKDELEQLVAYSLAIDRDTKKAFT